MIVCPTCGHQRPSQYKPSVKEQVLLYKEQHIDLPPQHARLMTALIREYPHILEPCGIFNALWPDPDDEPEHSDEKGTKEFIYQIIYHLRRKLRVSGLKIINQHGYGYRLEIE